jgi:hypothetical protein
MAPDWFSFFTNWVKDYNRERTIAASGSASSTGVTETTAATIKLSAGNNVSIRLTIATSCTNNANAKTLRVRLNSTTIQTYNIDPSTDTQTMQLVIAGRGAASQYVYNLASVNSVGSGANAVTENMADSSTIYITLEASNAADSITLESWFVDEVSA